MLENKLLEYNSTSLDDLHEILNGLYVDAWMAGYSYRQISAVARQRRWDLIYVAIVHHACIPPAKRGRPPHKVSIPEELKNIMTRRNITFRKWCHSYGLDDYVFANEINNLTPTAIKHLAMDFPRYLEKLNVKVGQHTPLPKTPPQKLYGDISIKQAGSKFLADAINYPAAKSADSSPGAALYQVIGKIITIRRIERLKSILA